MSRCAVCTSAPVVGSVELRTISQSGLLSATESPKTRFDYRNVPPPPAMIDPLIFGPSKRPPLNITVERSPCGPAPMWWKDSMSHSRWNRNSRDGIGRVKDGFDHCVFVSLEMPGVGLTVPCSVVDIVWV